MHSAAASNVSAFAGPCCGGLSEQAALARYPTSAQCRLKEGQEWLTSLRTEQRLKTQQGWRGQVLLCGGVASDASASSVRCYVAWHRPPIHEYFCDTRGMQVDFSASYWGPWSRKKALLPLARRGALRGRCAPSSRRWGDMGLRGVAWGCMGLHGVTNRAPCATRCAPLRQALPVEWPLQTEARHIFGKDRILGPGFVPQAAPLRCSRRIEHPVYLVARNDEWNPVLTRAVRTCYAYQAPGCCTYQRAALYVRCTRASLGRAVRTAYRRTTGARSSFGAAGTPSCAGARWRTRRCGCRAPAASAPWPSTWPWCR